MWDSQKCNIIFSRVIRLHFNNGISRIRVYVHNAHRYQTRYTARRLLYAKLERTITTMVLLIGTMIIPSTGYKSSRALAQLICDLNVVWYDLRDLRLSWLIFQRRDLYKYSIRKWEKIILPPSSHPHSANNKSFLQSARYTLFSLQRQSTKQWELPR